MSISSIRLGVQRALCARAAGRCQYRGCNKVLHIDDYTKRPATLSAFAHIIADRSTGPRGDEELSAQLGSDISNLMLLCLEHHRIIDVEDVDGHTVERLREMKAEHEARIARLTSIHGRHRTHILICGARVGERPALPDFEEAREAVLPLYPDDDGTLIDLSQVQMRDDNVLWLQAAAANIRTKIERIHTRSAGTTPPTHLSVFALAPIPLLIALGEAVNDLSADVAVYNRQHTPGTWSWFPEVPTDSVFSVVPPEQAMDGAQVAVSLSVSGTVHAESIHAALETDVINHYDLRVARPRTDVIRHPDQLESFRQLWRELLAEVRATHGDEAEIHLFPAVPVAIAVECGRALLPKADPPLHVWDFQRQHGRFVRTLTVC